MKNSMDFKRPTSLGVVCMMAVLTACGGRGGGGDESTSTAPVASPAPAPAPTPAPAPAPAPLQAPAIVTQPISVSVAEGAAAAWTVSASGTAPLSYQWVRNGASIADATTATYGLSAVGQLDDKAVFSVQVGNVAGSVTSGTASLSVQAAMGNALVALAGALPAMPTNEIVTTDGTGAAARFGPISAMASDRQGNLFVAEGTIVRKVTPGGVVTTIAGKSNTFGATNGPAAGALFAGLLGIAVSDDGTVYLADAGNRAVRMITPAGEVKTVAGGREKIGMLDGPNGVAQFERPMALALDAQGALYVLDGKSQGCLDDFSGPGAVSIFSALSVRKVFAGQVQTVPGSTLPPVGAPQTSDIAFMSGGIAIDAAGNLYMGITTTRLPGFVLGVGCGSFRLPSVASYVRKISPTGEAGIVAGSTSAAGAIDGPALAARFGWITQMGFDRFGALYLSDADNRTVRRLDPAGVVTTPIGLAGWPVTSFPAGAGEAVESLELGPLPGRLVYAPALAVLPDAGIALGTGTYGTRVVVRTGRR